jgi:ADP-ribose pyrophosphatase YjhB (NUDIX family)
MAPLSEVTQCLGLCFTPEGQIVLISFADGYWSLPGGTFEHGESLVETLTREVDEEACAKVAAAHYLASQHVFDPENPEGRTSYCQARWWARVELTESQQRFETTGHKLVWPDNLVAAISWSNTRILSRLLELALALDRQHR